MHSFSVRRVGLVAAALACFPIAPTVGQDAGAPRLMTHESYVAEVMRQSALPIADSLAVFGYVLGALPERVHVYPTENYYYFRFIHNSIPYAGNIRLDATDRDDGKVHFAYYEDLAEWKDESTVTHVVLDMTKGVAVEKLARLQYRISYRGKTVVFALNDLSAVVPPAGTLGPDEKYVGPVFDDAAIRFFLVYNTKLKIFHFILDETVPIADQFSPAAETDRILIGKRTGFAFYRDRRIDRKILIGIFEGNARVNNYFDGPFDQLPDNFIEGNALHDIIVDVDPSLKGKIDRLGASLGGVDRYLIAPYMHYREENQLLAFDRCATNKKIDPGQYYACFVVDTNADDDLPRATKQKPRMRKRGGHAATKRD